MADSEISGLAAADLPLAGDELIHIVQDGNSRKATVDDLVSHGFVGVRVKRTSDQTTANYTTQTAVPWQAAVIDADGAWSAGAAGRITVPAAWNGKYANVSATINITSITADMYVRLYLRQRNSADATQYAAGQHTEAGSTDVNVTATLIGVPIATGDYFEALLTIETDTSVTVVSGALSGMALHVIG